MQRLLIMAEVCHLTVLPVWSGPVPVEEYYRYCTGSPEKLQIIIRIRLRRFSGLQGNWLYVFLCFWYYSVHVDPVMHGLSMPVWVLKYHSGRSRYMVWT